MSNNQPNSEPWYKRWYVPGVLSLSVGMALFLMDVIARRYDSTLPVIAPITLLVSLVAFSLGWAVEKNWTKIPGQIREDMSEIRSEIRADIIAFAANVREPYLAYLRESLFSRARTPLYQLIDKSRSIPTVEECTRNLKDRIDKMDERIHKELLAVCGQKEWDSPQVATYYQANYEKSGKGVSVKRIFLQEPNKEFSEGEKIVLRQHISDDYPNVEGRVIFAEDLPHLAHYNFPTGFGFAILGDAVIVHWGLYGKKKEAGRTLEDPWFVEEHRRIFYWLWDGVAKGKTEKEKLRIRKEILGDAV